MAELNPYLSFNNNCEEAFRHYRSIFGGEFGQTMRFGDAAEAGMPEAEANKIMHMELPIGKKSILMGSDTPSSMGTQVPGTNYNIAVHPESEAEANHIFTGLAEGGQVVMPLEKTFWGAYFGMLVDKYGIHWMINYQLPA